MGLLQRCERMHGDACFGVCRSRASVSVATCQCAEPVRSSRHRRSRSAGFRCDPLQHVGPARSCRRHQSRRLLKGRPESAPEWRRGRTCRSRESRCRTSSLPDGSLSLTLTCQDRHLGYNTYVECI